MGTAYTPGLKVSSRTAHRVRRVLPIPGEVLVKVGDRVSARQPVAQTFLPGDITPVNVANLLSLPPAEVAECMLIKEGQKVELGQPMARSKGIFGLMKNTLTAKVTGTIENISSITGQVIVRGEPTPVQVLGYVAGTVVEVIPKSGVVVESDATFIQGIFGVGGETCGPIVMACKAHDEELHEDLIAPAMKGAVIVGGARMTAEAINKARQVGAAAIVSGGIDDQDLKEFLGYDLGVAITGSEKMGLTLIITEGFGDIAMAQRTFQLLASRTGAEASVNGATQIRAGVMRPEILVPLDDAAIKRLQAQGGAGRFAEGVLDLGRPVRVIRDPYFGLIGTVTGLPQEPQTLASGSKARVLAVRFESGDSVIIPRANVELIEG